MLLANSTRWKWSSTIRACGSAVRIPVAYGADGSIATTCTPARNSPVCNAIQSFTHAPERPGANPMIPPGWARSVLVDRSTIEVIHGFDRRHLAGATVGPFCSPRALLTRGLLEGLLAQPADAAGAGLIDPDHRRWRLARPR